MSIGFLEILQTMVNEQFLKTAFLANNRVHSTEQSFFFSLRDLILT